VHIYSECREYIGRMVYIRGGAYILWVVHVYSACGVYTGRCMLEVGHTLWVTY